MERVEMEQAQAGRWRIALLLGFGVLVNYFDRVNLSVSHSALVETFGVSAVTFGYLSAAYSWTYAACQLPVGVVLDRFGVRKVSLASIAVWGVASLMAAVSPGLALFFIARLLLGVGEAPTFPANAKAVGLWFPKSERSLATAIFDSAAKFASAIGVPLLGILLLHIGWRWSFVCTGVLSLVYFAVFAWMYRDPPMTQSEERRFEAEVPIPLPLLLRQKKILSVALGFGAYNYVFYLLLTWLPTYLSTALHISLLNSFLFTGVPWLIATATDLLFGGWLVDALIRWGFDASRVRRCVLMIGMVCGMGLLGAARVHSVGWALGWISLSIGGLAAAAPVMWSLPGLIVPRSSVGSASGIMNFASQVSAIVAPIATGYVVKITHSFAWAFGIAVAYLLLGILGYVFFLGKLEPIALPDAAEK
jgi:MFS family permease